MPDVIHRHVKKQKFRHILLDEFEILPPRQMRDVVHAARDQIIHRHHFMAARQQVIHQVRPQKTGPAGDDGGGLGGSGFPRSPLDYSAHSRSINSLPFPAEPPGWSTKES